MRAFVEAGVKPYYLHHGDLAPGTAHWRVPIAEGQELMRTVARAALGDRDARPTCSTSRAAAGKAPIGPAFIRPIGAGQLGRRRPAGRGAALCRPTGS